MSLRVQAEESTQRLLPTAGLLPVSQTPSLGVWTAPGIGISAEVSLKADIRV